MLRSKNASRLICSYRSRPESRLSKRAPSGPVSRILCAGCPAPRSFLWARSRPRAQAADPEMSRARRGGTGALHLPIWPCSAWGLPCPLRCRRGGALLPHRFTLAVRSRKGAEGGLFSVALSFALPRPGITRHAARMEFGLSSPVARGDRVARSEPASSYHSCVRENRAIG